MTPLLLLLLASQTGSVAESRVFGCEGPFTADLTEAKLVSIYGAANVRSGDVHFAEGLSEPGAVVFPDAPEDRIEVFWRDAATRTNPRVIRVTGRQSRWRTRDGITIGSDLKAIERTNRRPFRLLGFGWDYGGTVMSWGAGQLALLDATPCRVRIRLTPPEGLAFKELIGERQFSSGHPAMQKLNPRVYELLLLFDPGDR